MVIKTKVIIEEDEIEKLIKDHMLNVHKLKIDTIEPKIRCGLFDGFILEIEKIETNINEIHIDCPVFDEKKEKIVI